MPKAKPAPKKAARSKVSDDVLIRALRETQSSNGAATMVAARYGMDERNLRRRINKVMETYQIQLEKAQPVFDELPDDDIPVEEIIALNVRRSEKRLAHNAAKRWMQVKIPVEGPFAVVWVGDPHIDSNGCNWPLLKQHVDLMANTEGCYAANVGDTLDNWPTSGRLAALYAHSDTSSSTAWKLAEWFLEGSNVNWLIWLMGNHDLWNGSNEVFKRLGTSKVRMEDWGARIVLKPPKGRSFKVWASHNFPGHSMWNSLHGPQKAAQMKDSADVYVCGHTHNWALHTEESPDRDFIYDLIRARGYKYIDDHAEKLGHFPQKYGASVVTVFDPTTEDPTMAQQTFRSIGRGLDYLTYMRKQYNG